MSIVFALGLTLSLGPMAFAQSSLSQRLMASSFALTESNIQAQIWRDQLPALLKFQSQLRSEIGPSIPLAGEVFSTSFAIKGRNVMISVLNANCASTPTDNLRLCPARLIEQDGQKIRILKDWPDFAIASMRGESGYDASSNAQKQFFSVVTYDPTTNRLSFADVIDGKTNAGPDAVTLP